MDSTDSNANYSVNKRRLFSVWKRLFTLLLLAFLHRPLHSTLTDCTPLSWEDAEPCMSWTPHQKKTNIIPIIIAVCSIFIGFHLLVPIKIISVKKKHQCSSSKKKRKRKVKGKRRRLVGRNNSVISAHKSSWSHADISIWLFFYAYRHAWYQNIFLYL